MNSISNIHFKYFHCEYKMYFYLSQNSKLLNVIKIHYNIHMRNNYSRRKLSLSTWSPHHGLTLNQVFFQVWRKLNYFILGWKCRTKFWSDWYWSYSWSRPAVDISCDSIRGVARGGAPSHKGKNYIRHWEKHGKIKGKGEKWGENVKTQSKTRRKEKKQSKSD